MSKRKPFSKKATKSQKKFGLEIPFTYWKEITLAENDGSEEKLNNLLSADGEKN